MTIITLVAKDLRRRWADPSGLVLSLLIPVVIAGMMALAFGGGSGDRAAPTLRLILVDEDGTPISGIVGGASQNPEAAKHMDIRVAKTREEGLLRLRDEEAAAVIVIPEGFGDSLLSGAPAQLELIKNPSQTIMPIVAQQVSEVLALYLSAGARLLGDDAPRLKTLLEGEGWEDAAGITSILLGVQGRAKKAAELLLPPLIETSSREEGRGGGFDFVSWAYPGMVVMGLLFTGVLQMKDLLRERERGTLRRQMTSRLTAGQVLLSKVAGVAVVVAIAHVLLLVIGTALFRISWGPPVALAAVSALLVLAITGFCAMVFCVVRTERQGDAFGGGLIMLMSLAGGTMIPAQALPSFLKPIPPFTLNHWGQEALRRLTSGGGLADVTGYMAMLAVIGLSLTGLGAALLRMRHLRGSL